MRRQREKKSRFSPGVHPVRRGRGRGASAGFTLLEILLAVTLLVVVIALVYGAFGGTEKIVNAVAVEDRAYRMARDTLDTLARDLASLGAAEGAPFLASRDGRYPEAGRDISFLSRSTVPFLRESASGLSRIDYFLREKPGTEGDDAGYSLVRREVPYRDEASLDVTAGDGEKGGFILCESVKSMIIRFYREGSEYEDWDSLSQEAAMSGKVPDRITVELRLVNGTDRDRPFPFMTAVFIPLGA